MQRGPLAGLLGENRGKLVRSSLWLGILGLSSIVLPVATGRFVSSSWVSEVASSGLARGSFVDAALSFSAMVASEAVILVSRTNASDLTLRVRERVERLATVRLLRRRFSRDLFSYDRAHDLRSVLHQRLPAVADALGEDGRLALMSIATFAGAMTLPFALLLGPTSLVAGLALLAPMAAANAAGVVLGLRAVREEEPVAEEAREAAARSHDVKERSASVRERASLWRSRREHGYFDPMEQAVGRASELSTKLEDMQRVVFRRLRGFMLLGWTGIGVAALALPLFGVPVGAAALSTMLTANLALSLPVQQFPRSLLRLRLAIEGAKRVDDALTEEVRVFDKSDAYELEHDSLGICFSAVSSERGLENISFIISDEPGLVVVEGGNGLGKSTLLFDMLTGQLQPSSGMIYCIDGRPEYTPLQRKVPESKVVPLSQVGRSLYDRVGFMEQSPYLLRKIGDAEIPSIRDQLHFHNPGASDEQMTQVLRDLDVSLGLDERKESFSGGEAQQIALAAHLVSKRKILVLDEPYASLSPQAAQNVRSVLAKAAKRKKIVFIAHGLPKDYGTNQPRLNLSRDQPRGPVRADITIPYRRENYWDSPSAFDSPRSIFKPVHPTRWSSSHGFRLFQVSVKHAVVADASLPLGSATAQQVLGDLEHRVWAARENTVFDHPSRPASGQGEGPRAALEQAKLDLAQWRSLMEDATKSGATLYAVFEDALKPKIQDIVHIGGGMEV